MSTPALMVLGTASHVGKSLLTAGLCRAFARRGVNVAPFKAQNMSLNSAATPEGLEIGRAQALQAEAAGVVPTADMNPVLLKPAGNSTSQIVVRGRVWGRLSAAEYHQRRVRELLPVVAETYHRLAAQHDLIILEGAGSPAEINLKQNDIVNLRMAELADAPCLLVGDIDRGGVFASLLGTLELLDRHERARIAGFVINKFRGDLALLQPGIDMIEARLGVPCFGVVPHVSGLDLDEEDSVGLPRPRTTAEWSHDHTAARPLRIAVVALPSLSNFTDFDALAAEPSVELHFCRTAQALKGADIIILPGSKQTADDLLWLRREGLAEVVLEHAARGLVAGICGGMQMLGHTITDPHAMESSGACAGLAVLPLATSMQRDKTTTLTRGTLSAGLLFAQSVAPVPVRGYEIHLGATTYLDHAQPFALLEDGAHDGCITADGRVFGTYLHGIFDEDAFRGSFLAAARAFCGLGPLPALHPRSQRRNAALDLLADTLEHSLDLDHLLALARRSNAHTDSPATPLVEAL